MKTIDCNIIKDLLPSYSDKISSTATNKIVEEHLKNCEDCSEVLKNMNKDVGENILFNQEEIDYLKKYRKNKIKSVVLAIEVTIIIIILIFNVKFNINLDEIYVGYRQESVTEENRELLFYFTIQKNGMLEFYNYEKIDSTGRKEIHIKISYKLEPTTDKGCMFFKIVEIDENTDKVFIENGKGNQKEIWNRDKADNYNWEVD